MIPDIKWLTDVYNFYNDKYFKGKLPKIPIIPSPRMRTSFGICCYNAKYDAYKKKVVATEVQIKVNTRWDIDERFIRNTMLHEMIHVYECFYHFDNVFYKYNEKTKTVESLRYDAHGEYFFKMAEPMIKDGWQIEKYSSKEEQELYDQKISEMGAIALVTRQNYRWDKNKKKWIEPREPYYCVIKTSEKTLAKTKKTMEAFSEKWVKEYDLKKALYDYKDQHIYVSNDPDFCSIRNSVNKVLGWWFGEDDLFAFLEDNGCKKKI